MVICDWCKGGTVVTINQTGVIVCCTFDPEGCGLLVSFICQHKLLLNVCLVWNVYGKLSFVSLCQTDLAFVKICIYVLCCYCILDVFTLNI